MAQRPNAAARQPAPAPAAPAPDAEQLIESTLATCGIQTIITLPKVQQVVRMAQGIAAMRLALTDEFVMRTLMPLQGTALGFLTDKDKDGGYGAQIVRDCCIEAMLRGFNVIGNEFNIIAGRFYGTKAGFERQVYELPGLADLEMSPGVPQMKDGGALVPFVATWRMPGSKIMRIDCLLKDGVDNRIPVKVNANMGVDAVIGKAYRKMYYRIFQRVGGSVYGMVDGEVGDEPLLTTGTPAPASSPSTPPPGGAANRGQNSATRLDAMMDAQDKKAPAVALTIEQLLRELGAADEAWRDPPAGCLNGWTADDRRAAFDWARAFNDPTVDDAAIPPRPACTLLGRQPGEEG